jgi:hypothetical protein
LGAAGRRLESGHPDSVRSVADRIGRQHSCPPA